VARTVSSAPGGYAPPMLVRAGVLLIALSAVGWLLILAVPALGPGGARSAAVVAGLVVGAEVVFWLGLALAGRDTWALAREHGWRGVPKALWQVLRDGRPPARTGAADRES
jgi:hypothetical protein